MTLGTLDKEAIGCIYRSSNTKSYKYLKAYLLEIETVGKMDYT